ncbi:hypothetical protein FRC02_006938, partial [Tulasnella sp. 418]
YVDDYFGLDTPPSPCNISYWTETPRSTARFNFTGPALSIIGFRSGRGGVSDVYIDDALEGTIDSYADSSKPICDLRLSETTDLTYTQHELKLILVRNSTQWIHRNLIPDAWCSMRY